MHFSNDFILFLENFTCLMQVLNDTNKYYNMADGIEKQQVGCQFVTKLDEHYCQLFVWVEAK